MCLTYSSLKGPEKLEHCMVVLKELWSSGVFSMLSQSCCLTLCLPAQHMALYKQTLFGKNYVVVRVMGVAGHKGGRSYGGGGGEQYGAQQGEREGR